MPLPDCVIVITSIGPPFVIAPSKREINLMVRCNDCKFLGSEKKVNAHDVNFLPQQAWEVLLLVSRFNLLSALVFNIKHSSTVNTSKMWSQFRDEKLLLISHNFGVIFQIFKIKGVLLKAHIIHMFYGMHRNRSTFLAHYV